MVRIPAGPLGSLKCDPPKGNGRRPQKKVAQGGFRTVLWNAPKDLRAAVEDVVAFCTYSTVPEELLSKLATGSDLAAACLIQPYGGAQLAAPAWLSVRVV